MTTEIIKPLEALVCPKCYDLVQFCDDKFDTISRIDSFVCKDGKHYCVPHAKKLNIIS